MIRSLLRRKLLVKVMVLKKEIKVQDWKICRKLRKKIAIKGAVETRSIVKNHWKPPLYNQISVTDFTKTQIWKKLDHEKRAKWRCQWNNSCNRRIMNQGDGEKIKEIFMKLNLPRLLKLWHAVINSLDIY